MANESETVMAVCAEWRACIEAADPSVWNDERIAGLVATTKAQQLAYLDRIKAAWKREKSEIEANALAVGGIVEAAYKRETAEIEAAALAIGCVVDVSRNTPGNAAAMREALVLYRKLFEDGVICTSYANSAAEMDELEELYHKTSAALSAPARNCDRPECATSKAAQNVWRKEDGGKTPYYEWLLAPATKKGDGDGDK